MPPILQLKCKCSTAHHQTGTHHPALVMTDQVAWLHKPFQLLFLHMETSEWSKKRTMIMEEHPDVMKTIEILPTQVIRISHHTINLAQGAPMAEVGERIIMVTIISETRKLNTSPIPSYQQEQSTKTGMMTLIEQQPPYSKHTNLTRPTKLTKKVLPHWMTTLPHVITTQTLLNLSLAVIKAENSSPAETPPMLNYKAALSLRKKKTLYCKAELRPTCQLTPLQPMGIGNYQPLHHPRKVNRAMEPTWIGWPWKKRNSTKNNRGNERSGSKCPTKFKVLKCSFCCQQTPLQ